LNLDNY